MRSAPILTSALVAAVLGCGSSSPTPDGTVDAAGDAIDSAVADAPDGDGPSGADAAVDGPPGTIDARIDAGTCTGDSVDACGPTCQRCPASDREVPTCDGNACGVTCRGSAPSCTGGSCGRLRWDFEDGSLGGIQATRPVNHPLSVVTFGGARVLAVPANPITDTFFTVPICLAGTLDVRPRRLHLRIYLDNGTTTPTGHFYLQAWLPSRQTGADLGERQPGTGAWSPFSFDLEDSQFSGAANQITLEVGPIDRDFSGTIYFDDIRLE
jgi:hypothetical protein